MGHVAGGLPPGGDYRSRNPDLYAGWGVSQRVPPVPAWVHAHGGPAAAGLPSPPPPPPTQLPAGSPAPPPPAGLLLLGVDAPQQPSLPAVDAQLACVRHLPHYVSERTDVLPQLVQVTFLSPKSPPGGPYWSTLLHRVVLPDEYMPALPPSGLDEHGQAWHGPTIVDVTEPEPKAEKPVSPALEAKAPPTAPLQGPPQIDEGASSDSGHANPQSRGQQQQPTIPFCGPKVPPTTLLKAPAAAPSSHQRAAMAASAFAELGPPYGGMQVCPDATVVARVEFKASPPASTPPGIGDLPRRAPDGAQSGAGATVLEPAPSEPESFGGMELASHALDLATATTAVVVVPCQSPVPPCDAGPARAPGGIERALPHPPSEPLHCENWEALD